jgi:NgoMIV restriction enzyme.
VCAYWETRLAAFQQQKGNSSLFAAVTLLAKALGAILGKDYIIKPDILIARNTEPDSKINENSFLVDTNVSKQASIRQEFFKTAILHASISCKWTLRSDRAQNARTEALNLIRNRKGHLPHVMVVTAEPLPRRLASLASGTGDIDCVYHFALPELEKAVMKSQAEDSIRFLAEPTDGRRLKDISDLPLDLAV